jgi:hypothetical protein
MAISLPTLWTPLQQLFLNLPPWLVKSKTFTGLCTPCMTLCYTCTSTSIGINGHPPDLFWDKPQNLANALLVESYCTPCRISQEEKQLKLIFPLSQISYIQHEIKVFIHITLNECITKNINRLQTYHSVDVGINHDTPWNGIKTFLY